MEYERDAKFFSGSPDRRLNIRDAMPEEFDLEMPIGEWLQVPTLWVTVTLVSKGIHSVAPVYRGKQFWSAIKNDESVGLILADMARREGIDAAEFMAFERRIITRNKTTLLGENEIIH